MRSVRLALVVAMVLVLVAAPAAPPVHLSPVETAAAATATALPEGTTGGSGPGFGGLVAAVALLVTALLAVRRDSRKR